MFSLPLAVALVLAADPERPLDFTARDALAAANPADPGHSAAVKKFDGALVKVTGKVRYTTGNTAAGPYEGYAVRFGTSNDKGKYLVVGIKWADTESAARLRKQIQKAGRDGAAATVYGRLSGLDKADGGAQIRDASGEVPKN